MTPTPATRTIRRVLVALDASPASLAAARAAARLAADLEAELVGLFVEDLDLLHLTRSPIARHVDLLTAAADPVDSLDVERQLRAQADRARRALAQLAERSQVSWSFQVARGRVASEILAAVGEYDLVSLGRFGRSLRHPWRLGKIARALLAEGNRCTLLIERMEEIRPPVIVVFDGSEAGRRALAMATHFSGPRPDALLVLTLGDDTDRLRREATAALDEVAVQAKVIDLGPTLDSKVVTVVHRRHAGLVVLPVGGPALGEEEVQGLLNQIDCPVLAVS